MNKFKLLSLFLFLYLIPTFSACGKDTPLSPWAREVQLGFSSYQGNSDTYEMDFGLSLSYQKEPWKCFIDAKTAHAEDLTEDKRTTDYSKFESNTYYGIAKKWHTTFHGLLKRDEIGQLKLKGQLGPGIGVNFWDQEDLHFSVNLIFAYTFEKDTEDISEEYVEVKIKTLFHKELNQHVKFDLNGHFGANQEDSQDYNMEINPSLKVTLSDKYSISLDLTWEYDNAPPLDSENSTLTTSTKLILSF